jgi:hypothetical protein
MQNAKPAKETVRISIYIVLCTDIPFFYLLLCALDRDFTEYARCQECKFIFGKRLDLSAYRSTGTSHFSRAVNSLTITTNSDLCVTGDIVKTSEQTLGFDL